MVMIEIALTGQMKTWWDDVREETKNLACAEKMHEFGINGKIKTKR